MSVSVLGFMASGLMAKYSDAVEFLESLPVKIAYTLQPTRDLCALLGADPADLPCMLVTGTNGKGSVCAFCESAIRSAGYTTGLFISPHLVSYNERIAINGKEISQERFASLILSAKGAIEKYNSTHEETVSEFEAITACAIKLFLDENVDFAVMEIGMGGRLDSTNILEPQVSVITKVALDHMHALGNSVEAIAAEKAGIIRLGKPVVTGCIGSALEVVKAAAEKSRSKLVHVGTDSDADVSFSETSVSLEGTVTTVRTSDKSIVLKSSKLFGAHQCFNMAVAYGALEQLDKSGALSLPIENITEGFEKTTWPGRFEIVSRNPLVIIDGGHNPDAGRALAAAIDSLLPGKRITIVCAMMKDKDIDGFLSSAASRATMAFATSLPLERAAKASDLAAIAGKYCKNVAVVEDSKAAFEAACTEVNSGSADAVLVCGSLYLVGDLKARAGL